MARPLMVLARRAAGIGFGTGLILFVALLAWGMRGEVHPGIVWIPPGSSVEASARLLHKGGIIAHPTAFRWTARLIAPQGLRFGEYAAGHEMVAQLIDRMARGDILIHWVTFPEGWGVRDMDRRLGAMGLLQEGAFAAACALKPPARLGTPTYEGWLHPDTYDLTRPVDPASLRDRMTAVTQQRLSQAMQGYRGPLSPANMLTLASLVEREAQLPEEQPHIAAVFLNRLTKKMKLQSDPTVIYALGEAYDGNLTRANLAMDHPYNTYKRGGLPPGPIGNPGFGAIEAALNPLASDDLYFVARGDGGHRFSATLAEHNRNVQMWIRWQRQLKTEQNP